MLNNIILCIFASDKKHKHSHRNVWVRLSLTKSKLKMLKEKAGALAGQIWEALNGTEGLTQKQIKKATKLKADKDFFLGLGWLLREDKVVTSEVEGEIFVKLV